jgi:hypothetical protein
MRRDRLEHLVTVLERVKAAKLEFDIGAWGVVREEANEPCGTSACAMGYAALDPQFMTEGLRLKNEDGIIFEGLDNFNAYALAGGEVSVDPVFEGSLGFGAAIMFFEITEEDAVYLFYGAKYSSWPVTPDDVIARVRELLARPEVTA